MRKVILVALVTLLALALLAPAALAQTFTIRYRIYWSSSGPAQVQVISPPGQGISVEAPSRSGWGYGSYGSQVNELEEQLQALGYAPGPVDKFYSLQTEQAVKAFQADHRLLVTGRADAATLEALQQAYADQQEKADEPAAPAADLTADEELMLNLVNQERSRNGLAPLQVEPALVQTARKKAQDMIENNYFGHLSPTYGSPFEMMQEAGVKYRYAGENLAGAPSVAQAHQALMASPGHRANILNPQFTHIGIGIVDGGPYGQMFVQHFIGK